MTTLTLETPEARAALGRCVRLLLAWANDENETAGAGDPGREQHSDGGGNPAPMGQSAQRSIHDDR